ncbi:hypothetical protein Q0Z83_061980 [Actinoplanes sichuanensis]|uniref:DUF5666 domain-containing protein n=1 Tax=Actinoplanes sichuanensis TaxID=512349 RepID=A0ABW3ZZM5_9ACTN|nr:hypothetical protein [Actinoplanes sichuanensis]BEL08007.1 hypothetical protein Q0Z83_061980 [Actinoplanes sichuanensis]
MTPTNHDTEVLPRPSGTHPELNEALAAAAPRRWWNRTTLALLGAVLLAGGFLGGVQAHERWGTSDSPSGVPNGAGMPSGFGGFGGAGGPSRGPDGGAQPAAAGGTTGTVKMVDGTTLYVQTADGGTVTVRTGDTTTVKVSQTATLESITSGVPVTVEGVPDSEGIITATTVTAG